MKSILIGMDTSARIMLMTLFLLAGVQTPVLASQMWEEMFNEHLENAEAGEADAQYEVGIMYLKGQGVSQDRDKAIQWLKKASDAGNQQATSKLGRIQEQQDKFEHLLGRAESGNLKAQYEVAMMYLKGRGIERDGKRGRQWLLKAADQGDAKATTRLGIVNYKGEGGTRNYQQALKLFNRVNDKSALAQYYLGEMYAHGQAVKKDYPAAIGWYKKAAASGFDRAHGKIINLEEEIRIQKLRRQSLAKAKKRKQAARQAAANKPVVVASIAKSTPRKPVKKKKPVEKKKPVAKKPVAKKVASKPAKLTPLDKLASQLWLRGKKPVEYLPSKVTECDHEEGDLVCFSKVLTRDRGTQKVEYRVKSIVKADKGNFVIVYRNLVLDVTDTEEPEDQPLGYDDEAEQGFKVKTGWTQEHTVACEHPSRKGLKCVKDQAHKMTLVAGG